MAGLRVLDWVVLVAYLAGMVAIGACFYRGQKSTKDFFLAGRSMSWLPVGLSVVATLFSAISYMAIPSSIQQYGLVMVAGSVMVFACLPIVNRVFMPFYSRMQVYSAYEYLEHRFDVRVRCLASGIFIVWRVVWMSVAVYAPSLALWAATGGRLPLIPVIIVLGLFATFYTVLGGMKAVIWTDVIQFAVLFGGMVVASILIVAEVEGGLPAIWRHMAEAGKTGFVATIPEMEQATGLLAKLRAYFCVQGKATLLGVLVASFVGHIGFYTVDQVVVQRYLTTRSLGHARRSFWVNAVANVSLHLFLTFLGMALFAYFATHALPTEIEGVAFKDDWKYPYFIATAMPMGVAGLLIAALYAATMSSVDSGINSCTTAFMVDFWRRLRHGEVRVPEATETGETAAHNLLLARVLTLAFGLTVTLVACFVGRLGTIIEIAGKLINGFCGPMFAIFLLGMLSRRARPVGVCIGALISLLAMWHWTFFAGWIASGSLRYPAWAGLFRLLPWVAVLSVGVLLAWQYRLKGLCVGAALAWLATWYIPYCSEATLSFQWPSTVGLVTALAFGYGLSLLEKAPGPEKLTWTLAEQRKLWREAGDEL